MRSRRIASVFLAALLWLGPAAARADDAATRTFRLAEELLRDGREVQALEAFEKVIDGFPDSAVADDALLELARRTFDPPSPDALSRRHVPGASEASPHLRRLLQEYPSGDRAAEAAYLLGLAHLVPGSKEYDRDAAFAAFREIIAVHPGSPLVPAARRGCALAELGMGRPGPALLHLERLLMDRPSGPLADRARLDAADAWIRMGLPGPAITSLVAVRAGGSAATGREEARDALTRLVRLSGPGFEAPFVPDVSYPASAVDVGPARAIALDGSGTLHVLGDRGRTLLQFAPGGGRPAQVEVRDARCLFLDAGGGAAWAEDTHLHTPAGTVELHGGDRRPEPVVAAAVEPDGSFVVIGERRRALVRFRPDGEYLGAIAEAGRALDVESDRQGTLYLLDARERTVRTFDRDGTPGPRIGPEGDGYELEGPVDLAVDGSYRIHVLDGRAGAVHVFDPSGSLLATVQLPREGPGAIRDPRGVAVERDGSIVVLDARSRRVRRFR